MPGFHKPPGFITSLLRILRQEPQVPPSLADNTLLQTILQRRTVRRFSDKTIPQDVFDAILEAGRLAPCTVNLQTWSFIYFDPISWQDSFDRRIPFRGQRAIIIVGDTHRSRQVLDAFPESPLVEYTLSVMNASLAAMNMNLAAEALGVASVMLSETGQTGILDAAYLAQKLNLPDRTVPLMTIIFGYPRSTRTPPMPPKLPRETVAFAEKYRAAAPGVMQDWLAQMKAGYKVSHLLSSFNAQLRRYASKINHAEAHLQRVVFGNNKKE